MVTSTRPLPTPLFWLIFVSLSILTLVPIWAFTYFPSQDGPAHLNSVAVLRTLAQGGGGVLSDFYQAQWDFNTNQVGFGLLFGLGSFLPLLVAEKVLLSLYAVGLPLATLGAVRLAKGEPAAVLLSFPLVYTLPLYMGFYNFCLSLPLFVLCVGLYQAFSLRPGWKRGVALSLLLVVTYLTHIVAAASAVAVIVAATFVRLIKEPDRREARRQGAVLLALLPSGTFILVFLLFFRQYAVRPVTAPDLTIGNQLTRFVSGLVDRAAGLLWPHEKAVYLLDGFSAADRWYTVPYFGLLFVLGVVALVHLFRTKTLRSHLPLVAAASLFVLLLAVVPERYGSLGWLPGRFLPITCLVLIVGLSTTLPRNVWRYAATLVALVVCISTFYRLPVHGALNAVIDDYVAGLAEVPPGSVVLPLHLGHRYQHEGLKPMLNRAKFDALAHAPGYATLDTSFINLRNFEPARPYFPLQYIRNKDPRLSLSPDGEPARREYPPFHLDLSAYAEKAGHPVDYVAVWGDPERVNDPTVADLYRQLAAAYTLLEPTDPAALMRVYERTSDAQTVTLHKGNAHD